MNYPERALLLSIRPRYAESIMNGAKCAEIRRQRPGATPGMPAIIYATQPVAAVIGSARITQILHGPPADIWASYHQQINISRDEYDTYLSGAETAHVLILTDPRRLSVPITLSDMRAASSFHPPRSYQFVTPIALRRLVNGHPSGNSLLDLLAPLTRAHVSGEIVDASLRADPQPDL